MVDRQVRALAGRSVQNMVSGQIYKRLMKKSIRMMLFQVIQESVDLVYFLEEDTISAANNLLDCLIQAEVRQIAEEALEETSRDDRLLTDSFEVIGTESDQMLMVQDDEDCVEKHSNIQMSIRNSTYSSPRLARKQDFQKGFRSQNSS